MRKSQGELSTPGTTILDGPCMKVMSAILVRVASYKHKLVLEPLQGGNFVLLWWQGSKASSHTPYCVHTLPNHTT